MRCFNGFMVAWLVAFLLSALTLGAWALFDSVTDPTDEQIQYFLATRLRQVGPPWEPLTDLNLRQQGNGQFEGTANGSDGRIFVVKADLRYHALKYGATSENKSWYGSLSSPGFLERHPWSETWLIMTALSANLLGVVYPIAGLFGLRPPFSRRWEMALYASAAANLMFAIFQGTRLLMLYT